MNGAFRASAMSADYRAYFWSAEQTDASNAPILEIGASAQQQFSFLKSVGLSVRCVWDGDPGAATPTDEASPPPTAEPTTPSATEAATETATEAATSPATATATSAASETATPTIEPSDPPPTSTEVATSEPTPTEIGEHTVYLPMAERG